MFLNEELFKLELKPHELQLDGAWNNLLPEMPPREALAVDGELLLEEELPDEELELELDELELDGLELEELELGELELELGELELELELDVSGVPVAVNWTMREEDSPVAVMLPLLCCLKMMALALSFEGDVTELREKVPEMSPVI